MERSSERPQPAKADLSQHRSLNLVKVLPELHRGATDHNHTQAALFLGFFDILLRVLGYLVGLVEDDVHVLVVALHDACDAAVPAYPQVDTQVHELAKICSVPLLARHSVSCFGLAAQSLLSVFVR